MGKGQKAKWAAKTSIELDYAPTYNPNMLNTAWQLPVCETAPTTPGSFDDLGAEFEDKTLGGISKATRRAAFSNYQDASLQSLSKGQSSTLTQNWSRPAPRSGNAIPFTSPRRQFSDWQRDHRIPIQRMVLTPQETSMLRF